MIDVIVYTVYARVCVCMLCLLLASGHLDLCNSWFETGSNIIKSSVTKFFGDMLALVWKYAKTCYMSYKNMLGLCDHIIIQTYRLVTPPSKRVSSSRRVSTSNWSSTELACIPHLSSCTVMRSPRDWSQSVEKENAGQNYYQWCGCLSVNRNDVGD